jgi:hypothetical protein
MDVATKKEPADKPGSVVNSHLSWAYVTICLMRPTQILGAGSTLQENLRGSLLGLALGGVYPAIDVTITAVRSYRTFSPLPLRRYIFCGTCRGLASPRCYLAPCPIEPGLSSVSYNSDCLANSCYYYNNFSMNFIKINN